MEEDDDQITGEKGKASNTQGNKDNDPSILEKHDLGVGYNTAATMSCLEKNKEFFARDRAVAGSYGQIPQPITPYPGALPQEIDHGLDK